MTQFQAVAPELKGLVINAVLQLVTIKAHMKGVVELESARRLMTDSFAVHRFLTNAGHEIPRIDVERTLDVLSNAGGPIRWYDREYQGRTYRNFGLTKKFWADFDAQVAQRTGTSAH